MVTNLAKFVEYRKRGQLKIQQMAFVLIAVTLLFALAGMFFLAIQLSNLRGNAESLNEKNALLLVGKLANSPEFSCGEAFGNKKTNCVDEDKVMVLENNIFKYTDFWGVEDIEIRRIYPSDNFDELNTTCTLANYPRCGIIELKNGKNNGGFTASNFVALCRKGNVEGELIDKCELGRIIVSYNG